MMFVQREAQNIYTFNIWISPFWRRLHTSIPVDRISFVCWFALSSSLATHEPLTSGFVGRRNYFGEDREENWHELAPAFPNVLDCSNQRRLRIRSVSSGISRHRRILAILNTKDLRYALGVTNESRVAVQGGSPCR